MVVTEVIEVPRSVEESFAYVADFTTVAEWDPGIHESRKVSGDGGVGTVYEVQAEFRGKTMPFTYTVTTFEENRRIVLDGVGEKATSLDTIAFEAAGRRWHAHHLHGGLQAQGRAAGRGAVPRRHVQDARAQGTRRASRRNSAPRGRAHVILYVLDCFPR